MEAVDAPALEPRLSAHATQHANERKAAVVRPASRLMGLIAPRPLLAGVLIGFIACCLAGYVCSRQNPYRKFTRFHINISPDTYYYPTASQLINLARGDGDKRRITVVVGGSSVMQGAGQMPAELWTIQLQKLLGDRYRVVNLATRGGAATEGGAIAADVLRREGYPVIYVTSLNPFRAPFMDGERHTYQFWDAYHKGQVPLAGERAAEGRRLKRARMLAPTKANQPSGEEMLLGQKLDSWFYFNDLWTTVGYKKFFTVWIAPRPAYEPWAPRERLIDPEGPQPPVERRFPQRDIEASLRVLRAQAGGFLDRSPDGTWTPTSAVTPFRKRLKVMFSDELRPAAVVIVLQNNPHFVRMLEKDEQEQYAEACRETVDALSASGHASALLGESYTAADYADWIHLVGQGGKKLAEDVAPLVRQRAEALGYKTEAP